MNKRVPFSAFLPLIEEKLSQGGETVITITGTSMLPLLRHGLDRVLLVSPKTQLRKYDIPLYRRDNGVFVLHRVVGIKNGLYVLRGDNQFENEYPIRHEQIIGVVKGFWRGDKYTSVNAPSYRLYCFFWIWFAPVRKRSRRASALFSAARRKIFEGFGNSKMDT